MISYVKIKDGLQWKEYALSISRLDAQTISSLIFQKKIKFFNSLHEEIPVATSMSMLGLYSTPKKDLGVFTRDTPAAVSIQIDKLKKLLTDYEQKFHNAENLLSSMTVFVEEVGVLAEMSGLDVLPSSNIPV